MTFSNANSGANTGIGPDHQPGVGGSPPRWGLLSVMSNFQPPQSGQAEESRPDKKTSWTGFAKGLSTGLNGLSGIFAITASAQSLAITASAQSLAITASAQSPPGPLQRFQGRFSPSPDPSASPDSNSVLICLMTASISLA